MIAEQIIAAREPALDAGDAASQAVVSQDLDTADVHARHPVQNAVARVSHTLTPAATPESPRSQAVSLLITSHATEADQDAEHARQSAQRAAANAATCTGHRHANQAAWHANAAAACAARAWDAASVRQAETHAHAALNHAEIAVEHADGTRPVR